MHLDPLSTLEGRHLVLIYAFVVLTQGGYFFYVAAQWLRLGRASAATPKIPPLQR